MSYGGSSAPSPPVISPAASQTRQTTEALIAAVTCANFSSGADAAWPSRTWRMWATTSVAS